MVDCILIVGKGFRYFFVGGIFIVLLYFFIFNMLFIGNNCRYFLYKVFWEFWLFLFGKLEFKLLVFIDIIEGLKSFFVFRFFCVFVVKGCCRFFIFFLIFDFFFVVSFFFKLYILVMGFNIGFVLSKCFFFLDVC